MKSPHSGAPAAESPADSSAGQGVGRRRVALGAAWAVPTVALAGTAPAFAASCPQVTPRMLNTFSVVVSPLNAAGNWTNNTTITSTLANPASNVAFGISASSTVTYAMVAYQISVTHPYDISWTAVTGWTITRTKNGTSPSATYTFVFTALAAALTGTYTSSTANPPTTGYGIPTFTGTTTNAQAKADNYVQNGDPGSTTVNLSVTRTATYRIISPAQCATTNQTYTQSISPALTPSTPGARAATHSLVTM